MPWKTLTLIGERLRLVRAALKARQSLAPLCRAAGVSRKTLYKWIDRFLANGQRALCDQSRRPCTSPRQTKAVWIERLRALRQQHRDWGAKKIRAKLRERFPRQRLPAVRTIAQWIQRLGLAQARRRRSRKGPPVLRPALTVPRRPNQVWTVDFKGFFRTRDGRRVDPLTVRDLFSRFVLIVCLLPQFHRVLKACTTRPASAHPRAQQRRTNAWVRFYNQERPHEAIGQRMPVELYRRGARWLRSGGNWKYPRGWAVRRVRSNGQIKWQGRMRSVGEAFVGSTVGLKAQRGGRHRVYFCHVFLGELHASDAGGLRPAAYVHPRPMRAGKPKSVTYVCASKCYPCVRTVPTLALSPGRGDAAYLT